MDVGSSPFRMGPSFRDDSKTTSSLMGNILGKRHIGHSIGSRCASRPNNRVYHGEWNNIFRHGFGRYWVGTSCKVIYTDMLFSGPMDAPTPATGGTISGMVKVGTLHRLILSSFRDIYLGRWRFLRRTLRRRPQGRQGYLEEVQRRYLRPGMERRQVR